MIKRNTLFLSLALLFIANLSCSQGRINPTIKGYGGIFDAPYAVEKPDPTMQYKIVIDIASNDAEPDGIAYSLTNVARLMNLHAMGGVPKENMHVVLAIHGPAAFSVMNNEEYKNKYDVDSPYLELFKELKAAGVKMFACSQSLRGRSIDHTKMVPEVGVATSMLSVMTTYQLKGYAALKF